MTLQITIETGIKINCRNLMACLSFRPSSFLFLFAILVLVAPNNCRGEFRQSSVDHQTALFIFGDSFYDVGNNNYINTTTTFQANFWPYGETFFNYPTGRRSDGRLISDFIAEFAKLPLVPPYLQPGCHQNFTQGANFASIGAGALVETFQGLVIDLKTQVGYFKNVGKLLKEEVGEKEAKRILSRAVYLLSIGTNDYLVPLSPNSSAFQSFPREEYVGMVVGNITTLVQEIYKMGGRKFSFLGLSAVGCFPLVKALNPGNECTEEMTERAKLHNIALCKVLQKLESHLQGFAYSYFDFYTSFNERIDNPSEYGFKEGKIACCGSGPYRGVNSCGGKRGVKEYELCGDPSEYVYFDAVHPSEMANQQFAKLMWSGTPDTVWPHNLKALFEQK